MFGSSVACDLTRLDYQLVATGLHEIYCVDCSQRAGYGGGGARVENMSQVASVVAAAQQSVREGKAFCINAILSKSNFREGSISV
jgi:hypothetical protein